MHKFLNINHGIDHIIIVVKAVTIVEVDKRMLSHLFQNIKARNSGRALFCQSKPQSKEHSFFVPNNDIDISR